MKILLLTLVLTISFTGSSVAEFSLSLAINEFMASNSSFIRDPQGQYDDWIEIYNAGGDAIDIAGCYLTDDLNRPTMWRIPDDNPAATTIRAHGYLLIWADNDTGDAGLHANFKLNAGGEEIGLFDSDGSTLIDSVIFPDQTADISYGRYPDANDSWRFLAVPTPRGENDGAYLGKVADPEFSHNHGFYDRMFFVTIATETKDAIIYYTLDGAEPYDFTGRFRKGDVYTAPILISKTTCLRAKAVKAGWKPSAIKTNTYLMNASAAIKSLPVVSLVGDEAKTFYEPDGVMAIVGGSYGSNGWVPSGPDSYNNAMQRGMAYERPVSFELIKPENNTGFQIDCGIRVHGSNWMRPRYRRSDGFWTGDAKFSFRLYFRSKYGQSWLEYPLFPFEVERFKSIVLRGGHNDRDNPFIKDELIRRLHKDMGHVDSGGMMANLFINGEYKGYFNPCEHVKDAFCQEWYESDKDWDVMTMNGIRDGDAVAWNDLMNYARNHNLSNTVHYQEVGKRLDLVSFVDYLILELWSGNWDWPQNNWAAASERSDEGIWRFFIWDAEGGMFSDRLNTVYFDRLNSQGNANGWLYRALKPNNDFRQLFADRIYKHFYNGGALTDANIRKRFFELRDVMSGVIPNMDMYVLNTWVPNRLDIFLDACIREGMFTMVGPTFNINGLYQNGGSVSAGDILTMTVHKPGRSSTTYYTLNGSDPRLPGGSVNARYAVLDTTAIRLTESARVKARVLSGSTWSALNEATFAVGSVADNLRITEIMYHPHDTDDPDDPNEEYVELKNIGTETLNLNLVSFTNGIDFTFPSVELAPNKYVLVVKEPVVFASQYKNVPSDVDILGAYEGRLNNGGERIRLQDAIGQTILEFSYSDGWCPITDGQGFSLTIIDPTNADPNSWGMKEFWRASAYVDGSPGWDDSGIIPNNGAVVINEVLASSDAGAPDWIELYNTTETPIDIGGWFLSDNDSDLMKYKIVEGTTIDKNGYIVFYEDLHFGNLSNPGCYTPFALNRNGEAVYLSSSEGGVLTGYREVEDFGASEADVSFGRYYKSSTGNFNFVAMSENTPGSANAYPKVGPIVISEIMYNPDWPAGGSYVNDAYEYIELHNISAEPVTLYSTDIGQPWKFTDGIEFTFPAEPPVTIPAGGYLLVVKNPQAFAWRYPAVPADKVLGPYSGRLSNSGERVEISMPGNVDGSGMCYYIRADRVNYSDGSHPEDCPGGVDLWPSAPDGGGKSLTRKVPADYGNDVFNWDVNDPSPIW